MELMELIASAPWREAVTYRETWPHEYVVINRDGQQELLAAFCERISRGEGVECQFFHQHRTYLFLGDYKYWTMRECTEHRFGGQRRGSKPCASVQGTAWTS